MPNCIPDTLFAKIRVKRSLVPGEVPSNLELGELAVNIEDKIIYIGNINKQAVPLNIGGSGGSGIYTSGSGISISGLNQISFNPSTVSNKSIPVIKIQPPVGPEESGFLFYNGSGWELSSPATGINFDELFQCLGGKLDNNQYYIYGGNASGTWCISSS